MTWRHLLGLYLVWGPIVAFLFAAIVLNLRRSSERKRWQGRTDGGGVVTNINRRYR